MPRYKICFTDARKIFKAGENYFKINYRFIKHLARISLVHGAKKAAIVVHVIQRRIKELCK